METQSSFKLLCLFFSFFNVYTAGGISHGSSPKLFVFGDSYADTGNSPKPSAISWKQPYGFTFPGKPAGRFSDGRVLTDYIASFLGIGSPIPYKWRKCGEILKGYGMNFAHGGTGVFNTMVSEPNMTAQINLFQQLLADKVYAKHDLNSSIALVSLGGNDYGTYLAHSGGPQGLTNFTTSVINQLGLDLKRIQDLGVRKIAVTAMEPLGCLPTFTASSSYQNCSDTANAVSQLHNQILEQTLHKLQNESRGSVFLILDLYNAFMSAFDMKQNHTGISAFGNPLQPCCVGLRRGDSCGSVDESGAKKYRVCNNPNLSIFWDTIHPSQHGWDLVSSFLNSSLHHLF